MKTLITACLALALSVPVMAFAQNTQQENQQDQKEMQQQANQAAQVNETGQTTDPEHHMMGMVQDNGKRLVSGNTSYLVGNPHALKNYNNQNVDVKFVFDTSRNTIHIQSVKPASGQ